MAVAPLAADQTLTIEITTGHCLGGVGNDVYPGQVLVAPKDLSIAEARKKVRMGYARIVPNAREPEEIQEPAGPAVVTHQDPALESRDPDMDAPTGRRGRSRAGGR
jgi:hypothetical protein